MTPLDALRRDLEDARELARVAKRLAERSGQWREFGTGMSYESARVAALELDRIASGTARELARIATEVELHALTARGTA